MQVYMGEPPVAADCPAVDIGVIYTHEDHLMPRLLSTLAAASNGLRKRLILIDNASSHGVDQWKGYFPNVEVVRNEKRLAYSANLNRILRASSARYVLLLNTDMFFDPPEKCVAKMLSFMDSRPECGIAGCRLYHGNGEHAPSARRFQTLATVLARRFGLGRFMQRTLSQYFYQEYSNKASWECDWLSGCFMIVRRAAIEDVGLFDAGFDKYFEDVDMCLRMAKAGWQVMYNGGTYCYHLEQRSSKRFFSADARTHARAYLRWLLKWGLSPARELPQRQLRRQAA